MPGGGGQLDKADIRLGGRNFLKVRQIYKKLKKKVAKQICPSLGVPYCRVEGDVLLGVRSEAVREGQAAAASTACDSGLCHQLGSRHRGCGVGRQ